METKRSNRKVTAAEIKAWRDRLYWAASDADEAALTALEEETAAGLSALGDGQTGPVATYWKVVDLRRDIEDAQRAARQTNDSVAEWLGKAQEARRG